MPGEGPRICALPAAGARPVPAMQRRRPRSSEPHWLTQTSDGAEKSRHGMFGDVRPPGAFAVPQGVVKEQLKLVPGNWSIPLHFPGNGSIKTPNNAKQRILQQHAPPCPVYLY